MPSGSITVWFCPGCKKKYLVPLGHRIECHCDSARFVPSPVGSKASDHYSGPTFTEIPSPYVSPTGK